MNYSRFNSVKVKATGIAWEKDGLPSEDSFEIGFDTLLQNGIVEETDLDYFLDEQSLRRFSAEILEEEHGSKLKDFQFMFSILP